ncbi:serine hydroxymethyltransferase [Halopelagius longus]|uniref:serine hydroxymethyltransferase n=1 Tax=Halopelagius longus TaxID=1236180 RepID=UPI00373FC8E0
MNHLPTTDSDLSNAIAAERERQRDTLAMIASENYASESVLEAQGSVLTNKYAEGDPGNRYYAGCEHVDTVEEIAIERAKELFGAEHANVQPHSGTQANLAAYLALLEPGDRILSLELSHGGHLSHGHERTLPHDHFEVFHYTLDVDTGRLEYDAVAERAREVNPDLLVSGYSAYPRRVDWTRMQAIAEEVDAYHVADIAHLTGLIAGGVHPSPVDTADIVTCSTHKTIRAGRGGMVLCDREYADIVDRAVMPGCQGGPLMHNVAGKAAGFGEALRPEFEEYAAAILENAEALSEQLRARGLELVSGGTDVHFALVDLRNTHPERTGLAAERALEEAGIVANKSAVPGDPRPPTRASGLRLGTPALTTRGFGPDDLRTVANLVVDVLENPADDAVEAAVRERVSELCDEHPVYE